MEQFDEKTDPKILLEKIKELQAQLQEERKAHIHLSTENKQLKETLQLSNKFAEEDEECKVNSLIKYVNKLKKEKEDIIQQVEKEEEFITNTLQKKLTQLRHEKVDLENQLEREQEYIVHKLQKQLDSIQKEKGDLETQLDSLRSQLFNLRNDNFVLKQKIAKEEEKLNVVNNEKVQLELNLEVGSERHFNEVLQKNKVIKPKRVRSISVPNSAVYAQRQNSARKLSVSRQCLKEGWVKYTNNVKDANWIRMYARLVDSNELHLFESDAKFQQELPVVVINLDTVTEILEETIPSDVTHKYVLKIETMVSKVVENYYINLETAESLEEWKSILCDLKPQSK